MPRYLKTLTIGEKQKVLEAVKTGRKKKDIAEEFGIPASTLSTIIKNSKENDLNFPTDRKRKRGPGFSDVEECVVKWFKQCKDAKVSIGGPILKEKAKNFAKSLGHEQFKASNGWLESFKKRHDIAFRKVCGESATVSDDIVNEWKLHLSELLEGYKPCDIFNADETKCNGGKRSKERLTLLLAVNMTGTDKLKPLIIGKSKNPRCFSCVKSFPVDYTANKKAWMTSELFAEWLLRIDKQMKIQKRNILLFIDNCSAHNSLPNCQAVKVKFLPQNPNSKLQPLNQGIIKTFKTLYRKEIVRKIISDMDDEKSTVIDILQAMRIVDRTWRNVTTSTIVNCFRSCGFVLKIEKIDTLMPIIENNDSDDREWTLIASRYGIVEKTFNDFVEIDKDIAVSGVLTDDDITDSVRGTEDVLSEPVHRVSTKQATGVLILLGHSSNI
ncbi:tigger transposable element-derived protein 6-like [Melanaphis sacchari]|uniref:tigger transposable element-derived protein 6-like n=1 Tax=Melanaphis sacchari TaxID=742174 RepID=UPI000DC139CA|nr:tigger transposable element-derived protein 6-like [Melanaphis sacchari]